MNTTRSIPSIAGLAMIAVLFVFAQFPASAASGPEAKAAVQSALDTAEKKYDQIAGKIKDEVRLYQDVDVDFKDGTAHLTGIVNSKTEKEEVIKRVRAVPGVKAIDDHLKIKGEESGVGAYIDDASVTAAVKAKFLTQKGLDSLDISVETTGGVVTLAGQVENSAQVSLAEEVAQQAEGAAKVVNKLTVKK